METTQDKLIPLRQLDGCINTVSGQKVNLLNPTIEMINIDDISRGLAFKSHFGGQTPLFFSIATHCVLVHNLMLNERDSWSPKILLAALLHDASEAYIGDMIKPLKVHLPDFCKIEDKIQQVIFQKYGLSIELMKLIKPFDLEAQRLEYEEFYKNKHHGLRYLKPYDAYIQFKEEVKKYID